MKTYDDYLDATRLALEDFLETAVRVFGAEWWWNSDGAATVKLGDSVWRIHPSGEIEGVSGAHDLDSVSDLADAMNAIHMERLAELDASRADFKRTAERLKTKTQYQSG